MQTSVESAVNSLLQPFLVQRILFYHPQQCDRGSGYIKQVILRIMYYALSNILEPSSLNHHVSVSLSRKNKVTRKQASNKSLST
jgi:hypothetical protein